MSCDPYREKLSDALASGETVLGNELAAHVQACAGCREFYEAQVHLFGAIDSGVQAMVNEAAPTSLLPCVRARMKQEEVWMARPRPFWLVPAAGVLAALCLLFFTIGRRNSRQEIGRTGQTLTSAAKVVESNEAVSAVEQPGPFRRSSGSGKSISVVSANRTIANVEVVIPRKQYEELARFASEHPEEMIATLKATESESDPTGKPIELAPVEIEAVELPPIKFEIEK